MSEREPLGEPPSVEIEVLHDEAARGDAFVWVRKLRLVNHYADGTHSAPYGYFLAERAQIDAVCLALYRRSGDDIEVLLRSQLRPPLWFRKDYDLPIAARGTGAVQWELPAGLVEPGERGLSGLIARARAEALEETGYRLPDDRFVALGHPTSLSPGLIAEKLHFFCAEVLASDVPEPATGDGHAVEEHAVSRFVTIAQALKAVHDGLVHDIKTEVALSRLLARLSAPA